MEKTGFIPAPGWCKLRPMRLTAIALAWLAYFALHSALAAPAARAWFARRWPQFMPGYRAAYNAFAVLSLLPVLWLVYASPGEALWQWRGAWGWLANGIALAALVCFYLSTRAYDMGEFLGLRQLRARAGGAGQTFTLSVFHRYVRHPWYSFALALIWTRDMNAPHLVSAVAISLYLFIGSRLEERKLVAQYGEKYRSYMARVPGLIPLPWKHLGAAEAAELLHSPPGAGE